MVEALRSALATPLAAVIDTVGFWTVLISAWVGTGLSAWLFRRGQIALHGVAAIPLFLLGVSPWLDADFEGDLGAFFGLLGIPAAIAFAVGWFVGREKTEPTGPRKPPGYWGRMPSNSKVGFILFATVALLVSVATYLDPEFSRVWMWSANGFFAYVVLRFWWLHRPDEDVAPKGNPHGQATFGTSMEIERDVDVAEVDW